jgi:hypothetical protein
LETPNPTQSQSDENPLPDSKEGINMEGSYPLSEVAAKLQTNCDVIIKILRKNNWSPAATPESILTLDQVTYVIDHFIRNEKQYTSKKVKLSTPHKLPGLKKGKKPPKLTRKKIKKIRRLKQIEKLKKEEDQIPFLTKFFRSMQTRNPRGDRNFGPGGIWPVRKK